MQESQLKYLNAVAAFPSEHFRMECMKLGENGPASGVHRFCALTKRRWILLNGQTLAIGFHNFQLGCQREMTVAASLI